MRLIFILLFLRLVFVDKGNLVCNAVFTVFLIWFYWLSWLAHYRLTISNCENKHDFSVFNQIWYKMHSYAATKFNFKRIWPPWYWYDMEVIHPVPMWMLLDKLIMVDMSIVMLCLWDRCFTRTFIDIVWLIRTQSTWAWICLRATLLFVLRLQYDTKLCKKAVHFCSTWKQQ